MFVYRLYTNTIELNRLDETGEYMHGVTAHEFYTLLMVKVVGMDFWT